ncbi:hypothetical protein D3C76_1202030 [compost metagenome]
MLRKVVSPLKVKACGCRREDGCHVRNQGLADKMKICSWRRYGDGICQWHDARRVQEHTHAAMNLLFLRRPLNPPRPVDAGHRATAQIIPHPPGPAPRAAGCRPAPGARQQPGADGRVGQWQEHLAAPGGRPGPCRQWPHPDRRHPARQPFRGVAGVVAAGGHRPGVPAVQPDQQPGRGGQSCVPGPGGRSA